MSNPTSNFNWQMPTNTDLVSQLPADFEVFGQAVDTSLADLKGGTTGQVLKKNSNTDMDFVWGADSAGMTNPMTTTGDIIYSSSGSTPARLGIGTTGQVLNVSGGVPAWTTPAGGFTYTTWTPTFSDVTLGNAVYSARYATSGKQVAIDFSFQFGSTTSLTGFIFSLPVTPAANAYDVYNHLFGFGKKAGTKAFLSLELRTNGNSIIGSFAPSAYIDAAGFINANNPFTWANGNTIYISGTYEGV